MIKTAFKIIAEMVALTAFIFAILLWLTPAHACTTRQHGGTYVTTGCGPVTCTTRFIGGQWTSICF